MLTFLRRLFPTVTRAWLRDVAERTAWTAVQAGVGVALVEVTGLPVWWAAPVATGLAWVKGLAARHVGDRDSAATLRGDAGQANVLGVALLAAAALVSLYGVAALLTYAR